VAKRIDEKTLIGKVIDGSEIIDAWRYRDRWQEKIKVKVHCHCGNIREKDYSIFQRYPRCIKCMRRDPKLLIGLKFNRLTIIDAWRIERKHPTFGVKCLCDCGNETTTTIHSLKTGGTKSCGCLNKEAYADLSSRRTDILDGTALLKINNTKKLQRNNSSGYRGIFWSSRYQKWIARITFQSKSHYLGSFKNLEDAIKSKKESGS